MEVPIISDKNNEITFQEKSLTEIRAVRPRVYFLLQTYPGIRESDRKLIWEYWETFDKIVYSREDTGKPHDYVDVIDYVGFMKATSPETIRRAAAKMRELFPELRGTRDVQSRRKEKAESYQKKI